MTPFVTLWDLVGELVDAGASDREVVAIVSNLLRTEQIRGLGLVSGELAVAS